MKNITMKEIANEAGVSIATVSMILNKKDERITDATRKKVLSIISKYDYVPNSVARSLVTNQSRIIGLILPDISNPFFPSLARGAEDMANSLGYNVIFSNTDDNVEKEKEVISSLTSKMVDGLILVHSSNKIKKNTSLNINIPIVLIDRDLDSPSIKGKVLVNNEKGGYIATQHLINNGRKNIAFISSKLDNKTSMDRFNGYKNALKNNNLNYNHDLVLLKNYRASWGTNATKKLIQNKILFDGIFCGNDLIGISAMKELRVNNINVPKDVSIIGFDDIQMSKMVYPELTTMRQPSYEMGSLACKILIDNLENINTDIKTILLDAKLIKRNSVTLEEII